MPYKQQAVGSSPSAPTEPLTCVFAEAIGPVREPTTSICITMG